VEPDSDCNDTQDKLEGDYPAFPQRDVIADRFQVFLETDLTEQPPATDCPIDQVDNAHAGDEDAKGDEDDGGGHVVPLDVGEFMGSEFATDVVVAGDVFGAFDDRLGELDCHFLFHVDGRSTFYAERYCDSITEAVDGSVVDDLHGCLSCAGILLAFC
jgi:hypothetical protein